MVRNNYLLYIQLTPRQTPQTIVSSFKNSRRCHCCCSLAELETGFYIWDHGKQVIESIYRPLGLSFRETEIVLQKKTHECGFDDVGCEEATWACLVG